jgi:hypothetical protein
MLKAYPVTDPIKAGKQVQGLIDGGSSGLFTAPIDLETGYICVVDIRSGDLIHVETSTGVIWSRATSLNVSRQSDKARSGFETIKNELIQDGFDFTIRYHSNKYTIFASKPEWSSISTWRNGIALMPVGDGDSLSEAYQNLRSFLEDFIPGQV